MIKGHSNNINQLSSVNEKATYFNKELGMIFTRAI